jgi:hypothetical protein
MSSESIALLSLAGLWLASLLVSTWRFSSLATKLLHAVQRLEDKEKEQDSRIRSLDAIPRIEQRLEFIEKHHSLIPRLDSRLAVVEARVNSIKAMRSPWGSRPDTEE